MEKAKLDNSWGVKLDFSIYSDVRPFAQVEAALDAAGIVEENRPKRPTMRTALSRAHAYLAIAASRVVNLGGNHSNLTDETGAEVKYSLKLTADPKLKHSFRVNITCNNKLAENMGHVMNVAYDPATGFQVTPGTPVVFAEYGDEVQAVIQAQYDKFLNNYADVDLRYTVDKELDAVKALRILNNTNAYIQNRPEDIDRAERLYKFLTDCGQQVSWLGLNSDVRTRDTLLRELSGTVFEKMNEFEANLEERLNNAPTEKVRGDKARDRLYANATENLDHIMADAEYHATFLGVMAESIREREAALRAKVKQFLTKDFGSPVKGPGKSALQAEIEKLRAENAALKNQGVEAAPVVTTDANNPFADATL